MCWKSCKYNININKIYEYEMKFLIFQTNKIIKFFNGVRANDLFTIKISQTTSALSYIIIKMILFCNIYILLDFIEDVNIKLDTYDKINSYESLLLAIIFEKKYINLLDNNFNIYQDKSNFINKTMRMSVL